MHRHTYIETCTYISFSALLTPPQDARSRSRPDRKAGSDGGVRTCRSNLTKAAQVCVRRPHPGRGRPPVQTDFSVVSGDTLG